MLFVCVDLESDWWSWAHAKPPVQWFNVLDDRCGVLSWWLQGCLTLWQHRGMCVYVCTYVCAVVMPLSDIQTGQGQIISKSHTSWLIQTSFFCGSCGSITFTPKRQKCTGRSLTLIACVRVTVVSRVCLSVCLSVTSTLEPAAIQTLQLQSQRYSSVFKWQHFW